MKKSIKYLLLLLVVCFIAGFAYIKYKTIYKGSANIILLNLGQDYTPFKDIVKLPQFKNKVIYVDIWGTSCPPCFDELKNYTPLLTKRYKDSADIAFLYICIDRHPFPELRWKEKLEKFQPNGYHIVVDEKAEVKLATDIVGQAVDGKYFPYLPCYLIVDKKGNIVKRPTADPGSGEMLPSATTLLYKRLDSIRHL